MWVRSSHGALLLSSLRGSIPPRQPASSRPEERTDVSGSPLFLAHTYVNNNPVNSNDPSGHCPICLVAVLVIGAIVLTGDTPKNTTPPATADGNASNLWDLLQLGIEHALNATITGEGLQSLQNDPSVQAAEGKIVDKIRTDPKYGQQPFVPGQDVSATFTAGDVDGSWVKGALTGNPSFYMVHTGTLYASNTKVSADGTISTTWKVEDSFDYLPAWDDHETRPNIVNYLAYNGYTLFIDPIYYDLLHAEPTIPTNAYWDQVIPPEKK